MINLPELLAPAGDLNAAITAFENGADAVYAGLGKFNARERTENFTIEAYGKLMAYANKHEKKVYLTFNTLVKENEIREALSTLYHVTRLQPDAVITQDIGVIRLMKHYFPHIPVHASTQMGIHNSPGVAAAKELGIDRVILERQITMEELELISKHSELELEVFIHGALCCSLSGVCLFSSWMGGHSGNRGKCKQPCRRRYYSKSGNGFFFSTQDLYTLEDIPTLKKIGIHSLKIEGRLRKSDYVAATVRAYRMMLDAEDHEINDRLPEAKALLSDALGRKWSNGFFDKEKFDDLIESERLGVSGKQIGHVTDIRKNGFTMQASQPLKLGDKIRIQPKSGMEGPAITVTKITKNGQAATRLGNRESGFIHCDKEIPADGIVYLSGFSVKEYGKLIEQLPALKHQIDLQLLIAADHIEARIADHPHLSLWKMKVDLPAAENRAVTAAAFIGEFRKADTATIGIRRVSVALEGDYFLSQRDIRKMRQAFGKWLNANYTPVPEPVFIFKEPVLPQKEPVHTIAVRTLKVLPMNKSYDRIAKEGDIKAGQEYILPAFCPEDELLHLKDKINEAYLNGVRHFRVTALYQFELLKEYKDIEINTGLPLPVTNHLTIETLKEWGSNRVQLWVELEKGILDELARILPDHIEIYRYGRLPILQTRAILPAEGEISDGRGAGFRIEKGDPLTSLYPEAVFALPAGELPPVSTYTDLTHARPDEKTVSRFNFEREMA
jgi:putative protease